MATAMGVGRVFFREGALVDFPKFLRGGKNCFFPLKTKKATFSAANLKIKRGLAPPFDAHDYSFTHELLSATFLVGFPANPTQMKTHHSVQTDSKHHVVVVQEGIGEVIFRYANQDKKAELCAADVLLYCESK